MNDCGVRKFFFDETSNFTNERFLKMNNKLMKKILPILLFVFILSIAGAQEWVDADGVSVSNNRDYPKMCLKLINDAKSEINIMLYQLGYYVYYPGSDSNLMIEGLERAVKRGVKVTVVVDLSDWNENNLRWNYHAADKLFQMGMTVYFDHPGTVSHQKVMLLDGRYSLIASANWTHYSLRSNNEVAVVIDSKELYKDAMKYFEERKKDAAKYDGKISSVPITIPDPTPIPPDTFVHPTPTDDVILKPLEKIEWQKAEKVKLIANRDYEPAVFDAIKNAKKKINVVQMEASYYLVVSNEFGKNEKDVRNCPTNQLLWALGEAKKRGVDVTAIFDIQNGKKNQDEDFANRLLAFGVDAYYDDPEVTTHAKMLTIDDEIVVVGSTNWSHNATAVGNEVSVMVKSKDVAKIYADYVDAIKSKAKKIEPGK